jgi:hypothetical protein
MLTIGRANPACLQRQPATAASHIPAAYRSPLHPLSTTAASHIPAACRSPLRPTTTTRPRLVSPVATSKKGGNGAGATHHPGPSATDMEDLVRRRYFDDMFTGGDLTLASKILANDVMHKDMVRDEAYCGPGEIAEYMRAVKEQYPGFMCRATTVAPAPDGKSMFVAFEGHAAEGMPTFKGVDVFYFNDEGKVCEVNVYRSNWAGAKGHAARKAEMEAQMRWEAEQGRRRR